MEERTSFKKLIQVNFLEQEYKIPEFSINFLTEWMITTTKCITDIPHQ